MLTIFGLTKGYERVSLNVGDSAEAQASATQQGNSIEAAPLVTFALPCYNSASYMRRCIDSLLGSINHPCEILIVNDGSTDDTSEIAHEYARDNECVIAIDQKNANWGGVVNTALARAKGKYFKVVDSDDYLDADGLKEVLDKLAEFEESGTVPDMLVTNFVYDHIVDDTEHVIQYKGLFPVNKFFHWNEMGKWKLDQKIMIHAIWYRTDILRKADVRLPEGVSYMDSLLVLQPMPLVNTLYYLDADVYHYIIGREGQSVEIDVVKRQIDQQLLASKLAIDDADYAELYAEEPNRALLMMSYISCMMCVSTIYLFKIGTPGAIRKNKELWAYMKEKNPKLYSNVKMSLAGLANRRTPLGRTLSKFFYWVAQSIFKFA